MRMHGAGLHMPVHGKTQGGQFFYVRGLGRINTLEDIGNAAALIRRRIIAGDRRHEREDRVRDP